MADKDSHLQTPAKLRRKRCKQCKMMYQPKLQNQLVCSLACSIPYGREMKLKARERAHRARKRALKTKAQWAKDAQTAFNAFIRTRDQIANLPCVSCGRHHNGQWHAGHYRPVGGQGAALRYNELNCWRQCAPCNNHKSGALTDYRIELIKRIGIDLVEWLEKDHPPANWTIDELQALKKYYQNAKKELLTAPEVPQPF